MKLKNLKGEQRRKRRLYPFILVKACDLEPGKLDSIHGIVQASCMNLRLLLNPTFVMLSSHHADQKSEFLFCQQLKILRAQSFFGF